MPATPPTAGPEVDADLGRSRLLDRLDRALRRAGPRGTVSRDLLLGAVLAAVSVVLLSVLLGPFAVGLGVTVTTAQTATLLVIVAVQALLLAFRRIRPVGCLLLVALAQVALVAVAPDHTGVRLAAPLVAAYTCGTLLAPRRLVRWLGFAVVVELVGAAVVSRWVAGPVQARLFGAGDAAGSLPTTRPAALVTSAAVVALVYLAAGLWGVFVAGRRAYVLLLRERAEDALRTQESRARAAVDAERSRMARELHDVAAHHLSGLVVQAAAAERLVDRDPEAAKRATRSIRLQGKEALANLRLVVGMLREHEHEHEPDPGADAAPADDGGAPVPGLAVLDALLDDARELGDDLEVTTQGEPYPLPPVTDLTAYRVLQEALANARLHAPGAAVRVVFAYGGTGLRLTVVNAAPRRPAETSARRGFGLLGMRERAQLAHGTLTAGPSADGGWRVVLVLPTDRARVRTTEPVGVEERVW